MPTFSLLVDLQLGHSEGTETCPPIPAEKTVLHSLQTLRSEISAMYRESYLLI